MLVRRIFLASPNDVAVERAAAERVIGELNIMWSTFGVFLELIRWETHVHPGHGRDVQDVINSQIREDYDILLGIIWTRLGTPTERYDSGTAEEFDRALSRLKESPGSLEIMMYIKMAPFPSDHPDLDQLAKIIKFRSLIAESKCLSSSFQTVEEFERYLRLHLSRYIGRLIQQDGGAGIHLAVPEKREQSETEDLAGVVDDADLGVLEHDAKFEQAAADFAAALENVNNAFLGLGAHLSERAEKLRPDASTAVKIAFFAEVAEVMGRCASILEVSTSDAKAAIRVMATSLSRSLSMKIAMGADEEELLELGRTINEMKLSQEESMISIQGMKDTAARIPKLTSALSSARDRLVGALDDFISEMQATESLFAAVEQFLPNRLLPEAPK